MSDQARSGRWLCLAGAAVGALGLLFQALGVPAWTAIVPGGQPMMRNAALALLLLGAGGAGRWRVEAGRRGRTLSILASSIAGVIGLGSLAGLAAGRPAPMEALALTLLAASLLLFDLRSSARVRPSELLAIGGAMVALVALLEFIFSLGMVSRSTGGPVIGISVASAAGLLVTSLGLLLERPTAGLMGLAMSSRPGSTQFRRLFVPGVLTPPLLTLAVVYLTGALGARELAVMVAAVTLAGLVVLAFTARPLNRAHVALELSWARTRALLDQAPVGVFVADLAGRYTDVNAAGCRMLGYTREEIVGKTIVDLLRPEDVERLRQSHERLRGGEPEVDEWLLQRKDGSLLSAEVTAKILPDGQWQAIVHDISERRELERSLQASLADLNRAQAVANIGSWRLDVRHNELRWSEQNYHLFGVAPGTVMTYETFLACVHPEDREYVDRRWKAALRGESYDIEHRLVVAGAIKWVQEKADLEFDDRGELMGGIGVTRDITEIKRFQEAQRRDRDEILDSQRRLELALTGAGLATWDWNIATGEVVFNARWAELRGYRPEEVKPSVESWSSGIHPDDLPGLQQALNEHFAGRTDQYSAEYRVRTRSGELLWISDLGRVFARDAHGAPLRMVGVELDVTERKRLEAELRLAEAKASGIVSISADAIISSDGDHRITLFNEGAERTFGYSSAEAIGAPVEMLIPERLRAAHRQRVQGFAAGGERARRMGERGAEIVGLRKGGEEFPADAAISSLDVGGAKILTVSLRDITEQKQFEREQLLLAELGSMLVSTLAQRETLRAVANALVGQLADISLVEALEAPGQPHLVAVGHRDPRMAARARRLEELQLQSPVFPSQPLPETTVSPGALDAVARSEHRDLLRELGARSFMKLPLVARDQVLGSVVVIGADRAYSERDRCLLEKVASRVALALENARLYRVAQVALQTRDDVLGIVAHDLRNPLGTILIQAGLLKDGDQPQPVRGRSPAEVIERAARRMNRLIQDLLDVARIEGGGLSIERARLPVRQTVSEALAAQEALAAHASVTLEIELSQDIPDVWADRERLVQVFDNLLGNAIKFTRPGGRITVGAKPLRGEALFWVADTGSGIPDQDLPHLFERFWQARRASRRGAGLGLPIVKAIVDAHGGRVWVESRVGHGSTFYFTIPSAPAARTTDGQPPPAIRL